MIIYLKNDNTGGYGKGGAALKILQMGINLKLSYYYDYVQGDNLKAILERDNADIFRRVRASSRED
jgi:hypothetical protein